MRDQLVLQQLSQMCAALARLGQSLHGIDRKMEAVKFIQHRHVEGSGDGAFFAVAVHVEVVMVGAPVGEAMDQPGVGMKGEDHWLVAGEQRSNCASSRPCGCSLADCNFIRSTTLTTRTFSAGSLRAKDRCRGQRFRAWDTPQTPEPHHGCRRPGRVAHATHRYRSSAPLPGVEHCAPASCGRNDVHV